MKSRILPFAFALLLISCSSAEKGMQQDLGNPPPTLFSDLSRSSVTFTGTKDDTEYNGSFTNFQLQVALNQENPHNFALASAGFAIPLHSLVTDDPEFTSYLLSEEFFAAEENPLLTFFTQSTEHMDGTSFIVTGELSINGITKVISFPVEITREYVTVHYILNRSDFELGEEEDFDEEVSVDVEIYFSN